MLASAAARKATGSVAKNGQPRSFMRVTVAYPPIIAKLQWARLTKFIIPSVTDNPTESRKSSIPYAKPSNRTPKSDASMR